MALWLWPNCGTRAGPSESVFMLHATLFGAAEGIPYSSSQRVQLVRTRASNAWRGSTRASGCRLVVGWAEARCPMSAATHSATTLEIRRTDNRLLASLRGHTARRGRLSFHPIANKDKRVLVTLLPLPTVPWQITGNHWLALPCIHPADASIHAIGMLHRAARSAIEFAGEGTRHPEPPQREGEGLPDAEKSSIASALARPSLSINGVRHELSDVPIA